MFQALQPGMPLYILYKNELNVVEGRVVSASTHPPVPNPTNPMAILNGPVTDVIVSVNGKNLPPFQGLAPQAVTASFSNDGMFISEDKRYIDSELKTIEDYRQGIIDSYEPSKEIVAKCKALRLSLDKDKQKAVAQEQELAELRAQYASMNGKLEEFMQLVAGALGTKQKPKKED